MQELKISLTKGSPDYVWGNIWSAYTEDPFNNVHKSTATSRLQDLLVRLLRLAEYQLF